MPYPTGTYAIFGPIIDGQFTDLAPSTDLRDLGAVYLRGGMLRKVNDAGDAWVDIPGWVVSDTQPTNPFEGMGWFDTNVDQLKILL